MSTNFIILLEVLGTFAFAVSGIRMASGKDMDWFGAYVVGLVTAIGGGTLRDLFLGVTPFWMQDSNYFLTTGVALLAALVFKKKLLQWDQALFLFDAIGLGLFTVVGFSKSLAADFPIWVCVVMGAITGTVGGVIRDVLLNEVPLLFRRDIYALACVAGGIVYFMCYYLRLPKSISELITAATVIVIRLIAVRYHIHLPKYNPDHSK